MVRVMTRRFIKKKKNACKMKISLAEQMSATINDDDDDDDG